MWRHISSRFIFQKVHFILYCRYNIIYFIIQNFKHGFLMFSLTYIWFKSSCGWLLAHPPISKNLKKKTFFLEAYFFTFHILKSTFHFILSLQHNLFHDLNWRHGFMLDEAHEWKHSWNGSLLLFYLGKAFHSRISSPNCIISFA